MNSVPLRIWDKLFTELQSCLAGTNDKAKLGWLVNQGTWACEFARKSTGSHIFDLRALSEQWRTRWGIPVFLNQDMQVLRQGNALALEYLLLAQCWRRDDAPDNTRLGTLCLQGDSSEIWVPGTGASVLYQADAPLIEYLLDILQGHILDGELLRFPCPVVEPYSKHNPVDVNALDRSCLDDKEFERELIETFLAEGRRQFTSLAQNYCARTLHSLKGSAAVVGALRLANLLDEQEKVLQKEQLPELQAEFARVVSFFESYLK